MHQDTLRETTIADLSAKLLEMLKLQGERRLIIGIAGPPGAGKSKAAEAIALQLNRLQEGVAAVVHMDGHYLSNERLAELQLLEHKREPDSFDAAGFVSLLRRLRRTTQSPVFAPRYDRSRHAAVADDITITPSHRIVIVEGDYLLLDKGEWVYCRMWMDQVWWYFDDEVQGTDQPNAQLIKETRYLADLVIRIID